MKILGINAFHGDSSAALVVDGVLIAAAEEERFRRIKHWAGFPSESIKFCLEYGNLKLEDIDHIAINQNSKSNFQHKISFALRNRISPASILKKIKNRKKRDSVQTHITREFPNDTFRGQLHFIDHHLSHMSSAFYVSPFDDAIAVSVDGFGDFASASWGVGSGTDINVLDQVTFPHSLGIFYQALTQYLGFPHYGDEYKVMGLAPYGKPTYMKEMREIVLLKPDGKFELNLEYFLHHKDDVSYDWDGGSPTVGKLFGEKLNTLLGESRSGNEPIEQKHFDIAHSIQAMYEEAFFHLLNTVHNKYPMIAVVISGGCGMNSVANGKITTKTPFSNVYVQSAAGDAGGAIGAASAVWHRKGGKRTFVMDHSYWGPSYDDNEIETLLRNRSEELVKGEFQISKIENTSELCDKTAEAIAAGLVIGWFQGRMEWGPRALGNRSILGDPRRSNMKEILNTKIKKRESFRPFAPSVLREAVADWFELDGDVPFMMQVFQIKKDKRELIPAVTHVDGSGRLQTVTKEANYLYYNLIQAFNKLTEVPMLLNTSFNENEPVVCTPEQALDCFLRTEMDLLVLGSYMVRRKS